jgi:hypothetical protein
MNNEFEVLEDWVEEKINSDEIDMSDLEYFKKLKSALAELKAIKEAKPNEAMKCVDRLNQTINMAENFYDAPYEDKDMFTAVQRDVDTIKHSLLKVQEQEKELIKYKKEDKFE